MKTAFCNDCFLSDAVPYLIAENLLGIQQLNKLRQRYKQMKKCYDSSYAEWQKEFSTDLKPFNGYTDTTSVCIPILHPSFKQEFKDIAKGAIGLDLPVWFNMQTNNFRIMFIAQDPLRNPKWYEECHDIVISSPFGLHDATHRKKGNGGKLMNSITEELVKRGVAIYLTDANKYFLHDKRTSKIYTEKKIRIYADILQKEINLVNPNLCVCLGKKSKNILDKCTVNVKTIVLPHLSGTARGAIIKRFPKLKDIKATVENITNVYINEIVESLKV